MTTSALVKEFKKHYLKQTGIKIDHRKKIHGALGLDNKAQSDVVSSLYLWAQEHIESKAENYPHFEGFNYGWEMSREKLRRCSLKALILQVCNTLYWKHIEKFRHENGMIFEYDASARAYLYCGRVR